MKKIIPLIVVLFCGFGFSNEFKNEKKLFIRKGCTKCHKVNGMGKAEGNKIGTYDGPRIAGLDVDYIEKEIKAVATGERKSKYTRLMKAKVTKLKPDEITRLANYISGLGPKHRGINQK